MDILNNSKSIWNEIYNQVINIIDSNFYTKVIYYAKIFTTFIMNY